MQKQLNWLKLRIFFTYNQRSCMVLGNIIDKFVVTR